jgi:hypothetical protein
MTSITVQDGQIVLRDGAIGTEQACCCKKCEGPCDENEDCAPGCRCLDGECVSECSGPCENGEECDLGCSCVEGECVPSGSPCNCLPDTGVTVSTTITATFAQGSSCIGPQALSGTLSRGFGNVFNFSGVTGSGLFLQVTMACEENGWVTQAGVNASGVCSFLNGNFIGAFGQLPVSSTTVDGVCRLSNGNFSLTDGDDTILYGGGSGGWPAGFGLTLDWSLTFDYD